ncbi:Serine/threonine protein kinase [Cryptotrichosporon argae]
MTAFVPTAASSSTSVFIDNGNLELVSVIGRGAYGVVFYAYDYAYGPQPIARAVKQLKTAGLDRRQLKFQRREIILHAAASAHPSIIRLDRLVYDEGVTYVVMDYGSEGDLFAMITDRQRYLGDDELVRSVFLQLLDGVEHLHQLGIAHRDIKPENIVCSDNGTRVRLVDFGLATSDAVSSEFGCGSTFYIAPECVGEWDHGRASYDPRRADVWSLGIILVNLVCGRNPWRIAAPSDEAFSAFLHNPAYLRSILPISDACYYIMTRIFTFDPAARCSIAELRHLVLATESFTMNEEQLVVAHVAARAVAYDRIPRAPPAWDEDVFDLEDDIETPSLRADDSPAAEDRISRSSSGSVAAYPSTPDIGPEPAYPSANVWNVKNDALAVGTPCSVPAFW